jgi:hypothetical protein
VYSYVRGGLQNKFGFAKKNAAVCDAYYINPKNEFQVNGMNILRTSVLMVLALFMECSL